MEREKLLKEFTDIITDSFNKESFEKLMCTSEERVLLLIENAGGSVNPKQLSDAMSVTMPRITTILNSMDKKGYITRQTSSEDRRKVEVSITRKGRGVNRKRRKMIEAYAQEILDSLTIEEGQAVLKFLVLAHEIRSKKDAVE